MNMQDLNPLEEAPHDKQYLQDAADLVKHRLPEGYGFIIFAFPFKKTGRLFYIANAERKDCIRALETWIAHAKRKFAEHE